MDWPPDGQMIATGILYILDLKGTVVKEIDSYLFESPILDWHLLDLAAINLPEED